MSAILSDRSLTRLQWLGCVVFAGVFAYYIAATLHWPMIWDTPVMHYVQFLMTRGLRPYSQITDMNLPGCYLAEGWGMAVFGWSDLSWRVYEFFLMGVLAVSGMVIGGRRRWFAGIFAATFLVVMHGSEGPRVATERDELMMVLLVAATGIFFLAMRRRRPVLMLAAGLLSGFAASLKPGALLLQMLLLIIAFRETRKSGERFGPYISWTVLADLFIGALMAGFLLQHHALGSFLFIVRTVLPSYAHLNHPGVGYMLRHLMPLAMAPLVLLGLAAAWLRKGSVGWERWALFSGIAVGAVSYFSQQKGYTYHRYMFVEFVLLWVGWECTDAMRRNRLSRLVAATGVVALMLISLVYYVRIMAAYQHANVPSDALTVGLEQDLQRLGGDHLQQQVQCLDLINGCLNALYHLRLVQNTGATGDLLLFSPANNFAVDYYRNWFAEHERAHPADVVVLGNEWFQNGGVSFAKLDAWPAYAAYLRSMYVPVTERHFGDASAPAYRLYLRKGSDVLTRVQAAPLPAGSLAQP